MPFIYVDVYLKTILAVTFLLLLLLLLSLLLQEPTNIPSTKNLMRWVCARGWYVRRGSFMKGVPEAHVSEDGVYFKMKFKFS